MQRGTSGLSIPRISRDGVLPLSINQEGRLMLEALSAVGRGKSAVPDHLGRGFRLRGVLDAQAMEHAFIALARRHEGLRTGFIRSPAAGQIRPVIRDASSIRLQVTSVEHLAPAMRERAAIEMAIPAMNEPFDYGSPPLLRAVLVRLAPTDHLLVLVIHHLIADEWSIQILKREVMFFYQQLVGGSRGILPDCRIQHVDFAAWQREWIQSPAARDSTEFWEKQWSEFGPAHLKRADFPFHVSSVSTPEISEMRSETLSLPPSLSQALRQHARQNGLTLYTLALTALLTVLHSYTRKPRVAVMMQFASRTSVDTERIVGFLANAHLLGVCCDGRETLSNFVTAVRTAQRTAYAHQEVPLGTVWQRLLQRGTLFRTGEASLVSDVYVSIDIAHRNVVETEGPRVEPVEILRTAARAALRLMLSERDAETVLSCAYTIGSFSAGGVRTLLDDTGRVLASIVSAPTITLDDVAEELRRHAVC